MRKRAEERKKGLLRDLNQAVGSIAKSSQVRSAGEGEAYICSVCNVPNKVCEHHPGTVCVQQMTAGTEMQVIERSLASEPNSGPRCLVCDQPIPASDLRLHPTAEVCSKCRGGVRKVRNEQQSRSGNPGSET